MKKNFTDHFFKFFWSKHIRNSLLSTFIPLACLFLVVAVTGCSSSGGSTSGSTAGDAETVSQLSQYSMPNEISAVPVSGQEGTAAATDDGTDYSVATTRKYVEENTLRQFSMLEEVLKALAQTNYQDQVGQGPYQAMVAMEKEEGGANQKSLESWVCQADIVDSVGNVVPNAQVQAGVTYNLRARAWIQEQDEEGIFLIKAQFLITSPPTCSGTSGTFSADVGFEALIVGDTDNKKNVYIGGWDDTAQTNLNFIYKAAFSSGGTDYTAGFYEAEEQQGEFGMQIQMVTPVTPIDTTDVTSLWIDIGGSIYVEYKGSGANPEWVEKELIYFDQMSWTPEFNPNGDKAYTLPTNTELYINMQGATYVVKKDNDGTTTAQFELQTAVNYGHKRRWRGKDACAPV